MKKKPYLRKSIQFVMEYLISISVFLVVWQIYVSTSNVPTYVLPAPALVFEKLSKLFTSGLVWPHLIATSLEVIIGFALGGLFGMLLGYILVKVSFLKSMFMPYLIFAQTAPKIALVPLFVIWFGIGIFSKVVLIMSMVIFPVMSGMALGIDSIPNDFRNLMKVLKASRWQLFSQAEIFYSLPSLFSGLKVGIVQAVIGAIVAEWMSGKQGLGYILTFASSTYDTPMLIAGIIVTIVVGILSYEFLNLLENKLLFWHESKKNTNNISPSI